jgi:hypothetical protein
MADSITPYQPAALQSGPAAVLPQAQASQGLQAVNAFEGMDLSSPSSVDSALSGLIRAGAIDQAKAVQNLAFERFKIAGQEQGASELHDAAQAGGQPSSGIPSQSDAPAPAGASAQPLTPAQQAHQQAVMGFAKDSLDHLQAITDPDARATSAAAIREHALELGVDPKFVDAALGDLSDDHLAQMDQNITASLQHPEFGGDQAGPLPLHQNTVAAINHPESLTNPAIMAAVLRIASHGGDTSGIQEALKTAMGYQGPVAPGQRVVQNGEETIAPTYGPQVTGPSQKIQSLDTGATIAENPALLQPTAVPKGVDLLNVNVNPVEGGASPTGGAPAAGGNGAASPPHPAYKPALPAAPVIAAVSAHPAQYLSGLLGTPVQVTSTVRSPAHNAAVGGAPGSEHIPGNGTAVDFMPPAGMTHDQIAQKVIASGIPFDQLIFEANGSAHIGWGNGAQRGQVLDRTHSAQSAAAPAPTGAAVPGGATLLHSGQYVSAPFHPAGTPPGAMFQRNPDGSLVAIPGTVAGAADLAGVQAGAAANPQVQSAQRAITAYNSMRENLPTMTGPAAVAILGAMSGNTGASPGDIIKSFGLPQEWLGKFQGFGGSSPITKQMRQQIADAGYSQVQATYGQAAMFNGQRARLEAQGGYTPGSMQAALPAAPHRFVVDASGLPPMNQRVPGQTTIDTPVGVKIWGADGKWH